MEHWDASMDEYLISPTAKRAEQIARLMIDIQYFEPLICTHKSTNEKSAFAHFDLQSSIGRAAGREGWIRAIIIRKFLEDLRTRDDERSRMSRGQGDEDVDYVSAFDKWTTIAVLECG